MLEAARRGDKKARADVEREIDIAGPDVAVDVRRILGGDDDRALRADLRRASGKRACRVEISDRAVAVDIARLGDVGFVAIIGAHPNMERGFAVEFAAAGEIAIARRSEEHTSELQSLMGNSYAVFSFKTK